jgi:DNA-binding IclR family transcriptional regulator
VGRRSSRLAPDAAEVAAPSESDYVQVVARALDVLRCFDGAHVALGNQDIAARTGLPKSTVSRLTYTLTRVGHLSYVPDDQKYRPGDGAIAHASAILRGLEHRTLIHGWMEEYARQVHGTWGMTIRDRFDMVYLDYARAADALALHATVGTRVPLAATACGRAWVAGQPPAVQTALLADLARHAPRQEVALRTWLDANRASFARTGFAVSCGDLSRHINGIGVPVYSPAHGTTLVFVVGVLAADYGRDRLKKEVSQKLLALTARVAALHPDWPTEQRAAPPWQTAWQ